MSEKPWSNKEQVNSNLKPNPEKQRKQHVLKEQTLLERGEVLKSLNERLGKEVWSDFRCILNRSGYYNIMYKWDDLKIDIKQEDWVINLSKHIKEILEFIKKEWLEWNKIDSKSVKYKDSKTKETITTNVSEIYIKKFAWATKEILTNSDKILINSWYSNRWWLSVNNWHILVDSEAHSWELLNKSNIATESMVIFLNKVNKSK